MGEGEEDMKLRKAMRASLLLASERRFRNVSFPAISSGIFGFPKDRCAIILVNETINFLLDTDNGKVGSTLETVEFCIIDSLTLKEFRSQFELFKNKTE
jgi:O-acetyl-ADP-ribose deacetylase